MFAGCCATVRNRSQPFATVRNRPQQSAAVRMIALWLSQWGSAERVTLMTCDVLFSSALCANCIFSSSACRFAAQAQCFVRLQMQWDSRFKGRRFEVFCLDCSRKRLLECRFRRPCRTIGSFSRLRKSVEILLALQSRASFPRAVRECQILISVQAQHLERFARRCIVFCS